MAIGDYPQFIPVRALPQGVDADDRDRLGREGRFDVTGVDGGNVGSHVGKYGMSAYVANGVSRSRIRVVRDDHIISGADPGDDHGEMKGRGAIVKRYGILGLG